MPNSVALCLGPHIKVASHWQHVGDLIGLGFVPHTSCTRSRQLTISAIWPVQIQYKIVRFFAGIYSSKELDDMTPEQIIFYYSQNLNP